MASSMATRVCRTRDTKTPIRWKTLIIGSVERRETGDEVQTGENNILCTESFPASPHHAVTICKEKDVHERFDKPPSKGNRKLSGKTTSELSIKMDRSPSLSTTDFSRSTSAATFSSLSDSNHPSCNCESIGHSKENGSSTVVQGQPTCNAWNREKSCVRSREPRLLPQHIEDAGVEKIFSALTAEERDALPDLNMPLRHLRAEKGDVGQAIVKCKATLAWRKQFGVRHIISSFNDDDTSDFERRKELKHILLKECETGKIYVRGRDKNGRSIMYMRPQRENTNEIENNMRNLVYNLERAICSTVHETQGELEKVNIVIDYDGFTLSKAPPMKATMYTLEILQAHYCERLHRAYMCNTPAIFRVFWRMVKPFVDPTTKERIVFCNGPEGKAAVLEQQPNQSCLEQCAFGKLSSADFDHKVYLKEIPFHQTF